MLDVRWLEDLLAVAETRSYTRAAELRNVTQSGLSRRIQSLEHWVGALLVDRGQSPVELTPAGHRFVAAASPALGTLLDARREIREEIEKAARSVRLAAPHILSVTFFPRWLPAVQQIVGGETRIAVISDNLPGCLSALGDGGADLLLCLVDAAGGIARGSGRGGELGERFLTIGRERLIPLSAPDDIGGPRHSLSGSSLSYLGYAPECSLGWAVEAALGPRSDLPARRQLYENSLADGLRAMALSGLGAAWLPLTTTHEDILRGRLVRAGGSSWDVRLDVRLYRPERRISRKAEELWLRLSLDGAGSEEAAPFEDVVADSHGMGQWGVSAG